MYVCLKEGFTACVCVCLYECCVCKEGFLCELAMRGFVTVCVYVFAKIGSH